VSLDTTRLRATALAAALALHLPAALAAPRDLVELLHVEGVEQFLPACNDWNRTGEQLQDWTQLFGAPVPLLTDRHHGRSAEPVGRPFDTDRPATGTRLLLGVEAGRLRTARHKP
jgi:hypothetical protein